MDRILKKSWIWTKLEWPDLNFRTFWTVVSLATSVLTLVWPYAKKSRAWTILDRYNSNDTCIFYWLWTHAYANIYYLHNFNTCCTWLLVLWYQSLDHFLGSSADSVLLPRPSMLDCTVRTNDTAFYGQFHSQSPFTQLLMILWYSSAGKFLSRGLDLSGVSTDKITKTQTSARL